jgi:hypothetical protein
MRRIQPPDASLSSGLRVLRYPKIDGRFGAASGYSLLVLRHPKIGDGFAEGWCVDRYVAIQSGFLLRPCAPSDLGRVTVGSCRSYVDRDVRSVGAVAA